MTPTQRFAALELGPRRCPDCGEPLQYSGATRLAAIALAIVVFAFAVVLSLRMRSWWPYAMAAIALLASRALVLRHGRLVTSPASNGRTWISFVVLGAVVAALTRWL